MLRPVHAKSHAAFQMPPVAFSLQLDAEYPNPLCAFPLLMLRKCPRGNYCPTASALPVDCPAGTYQNDTGASECDVCPPGYYCEMGATDALACPGGHYCPEGTEFPNEFTCPNGTYSNKTGLATSSECYLCPPGRCDIFIEVEGVSHSVRKQQLVAWNEGTSCSNVDAPFSL